MSDVALVLLVIAGIFLVGSAGEIVFARTHVPDVIWLIVCGWALGPASGLLNSRELLNIAPYFASFALIVILFNGGTSLKLDSVAKSAPRAALLAAVGFVLSTVTVASLSMLAREFGLLPAGWTWLHGALLGSIVGGSSSIIVLPAMSISKTDERIADVLNLESTFTDALCVVTASAFVTVLLHSVSGGGMSTVVALGRSFGVALAVGTAAGLLWLLVLNLLRDHGHAYPITLAGLLLLYVLIDELGASAAMGVLTFAVIVGNARFFSRRIGFLHDVDLGEGIRGFHAQMAFIVKSFFFVLIGALLTPPWPLVAFGVVLGLLLWVIRIPAVRLSTLGSRFERPERALMSVALPRGMAAGVMATIPAAAGVAHARGLVTIVFACIVTTIAVFAVGLPITMRRLPGRPSAGAAEGGSWTPAVPEEAEQPPGE